MSRHESAGVTLLVAGSATGYVVARWVVGPWLARRSAASSTPNRLKPQALPSRALAVGAPAMPLDPYADASMVTSTGPSGDMRPIDPYGPPSVTTPIVTTPAVTFGAIAVSPPLASKPPSDATGPITSPSQLEKSSGFATSAQVRRFDATFERFRGSLPIEYVRALVQRESNGLPTVRTGRAIGLMQITPVVLADYNKRHGTSYRSDQLVEPSINVPIGCELLRLIIESYRVNHPGIASLQANWSNPQFVELLTFGWNAGFSEAGGVGRVARYLEGIGARDITIDQVSAHAKLAGASKHLSNPAKVAWCKSVAALYQRERRTIALS